MSIYRCSKTMLFALIHFEQNQLERLIRRKVRELEMPLSPAR